MTDDRPTPHDHPLELRVAELEQRLALLGALHRVAQSTARAPSPGRVLVEVAREIGAALPRVFVVSVSEWDRRHGLIRDTFEYKPREDRRVPVPGSEFKLAGLPELHALLRAGTGHLQSLRTGEGTSRAQVAYMKPFGWHTLLQVPLASGGRVLGVIEIADVEEARPFAAHEIEFCETLATQAAMTMQQAHLFERIRRMADRDALTGLANPRVFRRRAAAAERAAVRHRTPLGVLVIDIDDFKRVNDDHGHAHGDRVLLSAAGILRDHARSTDLAGRLGGDELALLLPRTTPDAVEAVAERIARALTVRGVHVSIGVATLPGERADGDDLLEAADQALLRAKRAGKHRIVRAA
jgi:diguanylate cyclase (GGDEF)-like protein